ncbi:MAG TPA: SRPBCC domain-containing protein [Cyclobacteriaceae bacterium]
MEAKDELLIIREFNAPRELVFDACTKPEHLSKWWGPKGSKINILKINAKAGGTFHYELSYPDNTSMYGKFVYQEIIKPERIVFVSSFADKVGNIIQAPFPIKFPNEILNTWVFSEHNGKTKITLTGKAINGTKEEHESYRNLFSSMQQGFAGTFDQLDEHLKNLITI